MNKGGNETTGQNKKVDIDAEGLTSDDTVRLWCAMKKKKRKNLTCILDNMDASICAI